MNDFATRSGDLHVFIFSLVLCIVSFTDASFTALYIVPLKMNFVMLCSYAMMFSC